MAESDPIFARGAVMDALKKTPSMCSPTVLDMTPEIQDIRIQTLLIRVKHPRILGPRAVRDYVNRG